MRRYAMRRYAMRRIPNRSILIVEDNEEEPISVVDDAAASNTSANKLDAQSDSDEITIENPSPASPSKEDRAAGQNDDAFLQTHSQESSKHALATRLYKAVETAYGSVYELTEVLNEIGRRYKAPALKNLGSQSVNLQASIEGMPGLLDGKHEKEDVVRFMGLMDEITND